jgi:5-enolpyruvylshikimate-3-phosphate synthase
MKLSLGEKDLRDLANLQVLDAGNSGTTARLITGLLSAQNFETTIIGDESLSKDQWTE